jgi:hypothetical protein
MAIVAAMVALVGVVPIDDVDAAIRVETLVEGLGPTVIEVEEVLAVFAHVSRATGDRQVDVEPLSVDVADDQVVAV